MEAVVTTQEAGTAEGALDGAPESQSAAPDSRAAEGGTAQPEKTGGNKPETLRKLLRREKDNPNVKFTDSELDILDEHYAGKLKPASKPANPKAEEVSKPADEDGEDAPEESETEREAPEETKAPEIPAEIESLMKEVGAKSPKEILAKVKALKSLTGSKDAQAVAQLTKEKSDLVSGAARLWGDVKAGNPEALAFVEKTFGFKAVPIGQQAPPAQAQAQPQGRSYIDPKLFIDPESAEQANSVLKQRDQELDDLKSKFQMFDQERQQNRQITALQQAQGHVVDEMVEVAQGIDSLKSIPGLREAIKAWHEGKSDARMESFNELFGIVDEAAKQGQSINLKQAQLIQRGRDAERLIAEAEERGRKAAYGHKPNPSLSGQQGGKGEANYQPLTDAQVEAMEADGGHRLMPDDWFDNNGKPDKTKIPKKAWRIFDLS